MRIAPLPPHERLLWEGYPSWADHTLLFLFMGAALLRAALAFRSGEWETAGLYLLAIGFFFAIAALFRYAAFYQISSERIRVTAGLGSWRVREIPLARIRSVTVRHELFNRWFDLGSLEITPQEGQEGVQESLILKGIPDPDRLKRQLDRFAGLGATSSMQ